MYASVFVVNDQREVLLVREGKEAMLNLWNFPGGHVEPEEEFEVAAIREAKEETGLDVELSSLLHIFVGEKVGSLHFVFLATARSGDIKISDKNILEAKWWPIDEVRVMKNLVRPEKIHATCVSYDANIRAPSDLIQYRRQALTQD